MGRPRAHGRANTRGDDFTLLSWQDTNLRPGDSFGEIHPSEKYDAAQQEWEQ